MDYFTHYYKRGSSPFRTLSALTDEEAKKVMEQLADDSPLFARFKTPQQYLNTRKQVENWLRGEFIAKGGLPKDDYPLYAVLGSSSWIESHSASFDIEKIQIPVSSFDERDISFTFPDSMVSYWLGNDKPADYYQEEYHGKVFTLSEVKALVDAIGVAEAEWKVTLPADVAPYLEVQIWNHKPLFK
ncbi:hypothetical protein I6N90_13685 [Paenibacillus sp. GSMTC-2017]|uniref:hypothetical protein n=1 Tax=Paenibacillus sp. GSMTC-2017 TaxID=2794350 RepID=UPI0018D6A1DA|nr:hypothetical protein [Paenibacillus sp. GSMTC-2017]MBH5318851.1 hypothetical protein [Paenibacillus sp. GSMTC-2017]